MFSNIARPAVKKVLAVSANSSKVVRNYHGPIFKTSTMDDLPVPCGSWQANHDANQAKYNMRLAGGILLTVGTIIVAKVSDLFTFNMSPPPLD